MDDFYITVQSDSSPEHFPRNTITTFRNHFSLPIVLSNPSYQVALVDCSYIHSSIVIHKGDLMGTWTIGPEVLLYYSQRDIHSKQQLLDMLVEEFHLNIKLNGDTIEKCEVAGIPPDAEWKNILYHIQYATEKDKKLVTLVINWLPKIAAILGCDEETQGFNHPLSLRAGQTNLYIYTDIVDQQRVGSSLAPFLRKVSYKGSHGEQITQEFKHLYYLNVCKSDFENILIYMRTESGEPPPLQIGTFSATLHFRSKTY